MAAEQNMAMTTTQKIVAIAVTIIIISTVAIPIINDLQSSIHSTGQNTDFYYNVAESENLTMDIVYDSDASTVTVGTYVVDVADLTGLFQPTLYASLDGSLIIWFQGTIRLFDGSALYSNITSISFVDGEYTAVGGSTPPSGTASGKALYASESGSYGALLDQTANTLNVNYSSEFYLWRLNGTLNSVSNSFIFSHGTIKDGVSLDIFSISSGTVNSWTNEVGTITYEEKSGYYELSNSLSYTAKTPGDASVSGTVACTVICPVEYTYLSSDDSAMINLIGTIPILLILVPVMLAVRMITLRRN